MDSDLQNDSPFQSFATAVSWSLWNLFLLLKLFLFFVLLKKCRAFVSSEGIELCGFSGVGECHYRLFLY